MGAAASQAPPLHPGNRPLSSLQPLPPHVRIWDSVSLSTLHVLGLGVFDRAVCCVGFSKSVSPAPGPFACPLLQSQESAFTSPTAHSRYGAMGWGPPTTPPCLNGDVTGIGHAPSQAKPW